MRLSTIWILSVCLLSGCGGLLGNSKGSMPTYFERYGKVYYLDGAGNLGYGQDTVPKALRVAGFKGDIEIFQWTSYTTFAEGIGKDLDGFFGDATLLYGYTTHCCVQPRFKIGFNVRFRPSWLLKIQDIVEAAVG